MIGAASCSICTRESHEVRDVPVSHSAMRNVNVRFCMTLIRSMRLWVLLITTCSVHVLAQNSEWYVELGAGPAFSNPLKHAGFNGDNICYPTNSCANEPSGYRWWYDLDAKGVGTLRSLSAGLSIFTGLRWKIQCVGLS